MEGWTRNQANYNETQIGYLTELRIYQASDFCSSCRQKMKCAFQHQESPGGGTCENFDRDARVIFLGLKFTKMSFFWVSLSWRHFFGVDKIAVIFLGSLKICGIFLGY